MLAFSKFVFYLSLNIIYLFSSKVNVLLLLLFVKVIEDSKNEKG